MKTLILWILLFPLVAFTQTNTEIEKAEYYVKKYVLVPLTQHEYDALVSFCYSVGGSSFASSSLLEKVNANETDSTVIEKCFTMWDKITVNGKLVEFPSITKRRKQEADMYLKNIYDSSH